MTNHIILAALVCGVLLFAAVIGGLIWSSRRPRTAAVWEEPMEWEHSDYQPPVRTRINADHIIKED